MPGKLGHSILAADFDEHIVHVHGVGFRFGNILAVFGLAIHGSLSEIADSQGSSFDRRVGCALLAYVGERLLDLFVGDRDFGFIGAQIFVALDLNLGQNFEAGLESQRLAVVDVKIGDARLRNWNQALLLSFPAKVLGDEGFDHVVLETIAETLADDRGGNVPGAKARQPRTLLIALNLQLGFTGNFGGRDLDGDLALYVLTGGFRLRDGSFLRIFLGLCFFSDLCGAHVAPFASRCLRRLSRANGAKPNSYGVNLSVKREAGSVKRR